MKLRAYTLIISAIVLLSSFNFGPGKSQDGVVFYSGTYDNLLREARKQNKPVILDFWASWCGPCRKEIPNLKKIYSKYKDKGFKIVSVSIDNKEEDWKKALEKEQLPYIKLWDEEKITQKLYQYQGIPWMVLLNPDGEIERINDGLRGEELEKTIESLYNELK